MKFFEVFCAASRFVVERLVELIAFAAYQVVAGTWVAHPGVVVGVIRDSGRVTILAGSFLLHTRKPKQLQDVHSASSKLSPVR